MACYHPLKAYIIGINNKTGKDAILIKPYDFEMDKPYKIVPCGKCIGCRVSKAIEWSNRCLCEMQYHEQSYFVTLTYNEEHIHRVLSYDENGFPRLCSTLCKDDVQRFLKRLRKWWCKNNEPEYTEITDLNGNPKMRYNPNTGDNEVVRTLSNGIRYFGCGEYGETTRRAHYHIILFGLKLDESKLKFYKVNELGQTIYTHPDLDKLWSENGEQLGYVTVARATRETCGYVAGYTTKKLYGVESSVYTQRNIVAPYLMMSLKPGIGYQYLVDNVDKMDSVIRIGTANGSTHFYPPKYFNNKYEEECLDSFEVEERRSYKQYYAECRKENILRETDCTYEEYLSKAELAFKQKKSTSRKRIDN